MDTYTKNYWSLYLDFLDIFESLHFEGYSLPYLCHFKSLIKRNKHLNRSLHDDTIYESLYNHVINETDIQDRFDIFRDKHRSDKLNHHIDGKILFYDIYNLLRIPKTFIDEYFSPKNAMFITEITKKRKTNSTALQIQQFIQSTEKIEAKMDIINSVVKKAYQLFSKYQNHMMISDRHFQDIFIKQINKIMRRIIEVTDFLNEEQISCVVVPSTHYPECRTLVMIAQEKGIPTICLQHGIISGEIGYLPQIANVDAVYGQFEVEWYKQKGVKDEHLEIVGHPRFDQRFLKRKVTKSFFEQKLNLDPAKKTILIGVRGEKNIGEWRELIQILSRKDIYNIVVRDFPNVKTHKLSKEFPNVFTAGDFQLYDVINHVDAVVAYSSTIALEAMLIGKPAFILNKHFPSYTGYFDSLGNVVQDSPLKLANKIKKYFNNKSFQNNVHNNRVKFLSFAYGNIDELSSVRLIKLIERLTSTS